MYLKSDGRGTSTDQTNTRGKKGRKKIFNIAFGRNYLEYRSEASYSRFSKCSYLSNGGVLSSCCAEHNLNLRYIVSFNRIYSWLERIKNGSEFCTSKIVQSYYLRCWHTFVFHRFWKSWSIWHDFEIISWVMSAFEWCNHQIRQTSLTN